MSRVVLGNVLTLAGIGDVTPGSEAAIAGCFVTISAY
jgi:hypothetical protein